MEIDLRFNNLGYNKESLKYLGEGLKLLSNKKLQHLKLQVLTWNYLEEN